MTVQRIISMPEFTGSNGYMAVDNNIGTFKMSIDSLSDVIVAPAVADEGVERVNGDTRLHNSITELNDNLNSEIERVETGIGENRNAINGKVDKVDGMGLSHNDFTNDFHEKLSNIELSIDPDDPECLVLSR